MRSLRVEALNPALRNDSNIIQSSVAATRTTLTLHYPALCRRGSSPRAHEELTQWQPNLSIGSVPLYPIHHHPISDCFLLTMGSISVTTSDDRNGGSYDASAPGSVAAIQGYRITEVPLGTKWRMKVIILGAGVSGISFFKRAEEQLENVEIVCYEKNHDVGGTVCIQRNNMLCHSSEALPVCTGLMKPHWRISGSRTGTLV